MPSGSASGSAASGSCAGTASAAHFARSVTSGPDLPPRHLALDLALGLDIPVDLLAQLVRLGNVEVNLLLEDVTQPAARHADVIEVLHQNQRIHRREVVRVVHLLHGGILPTTRRRTASRATA